MMHRRGLGIASLMAAASLTNTRPEEVDGQAVVITGGEKVTADEIKKIIAEHRSAARTQTVQIVERIEARDAALRREIAEWNRAVDQRKKGKK